MRFLAFVICSIGVFVSGTAYSAAPMPSSGTCALMVRYEIPFGIDAATRGAGGYPFSTIGSVTFKGSGKGEVSVFDVNVDYSTQGSPMVRNWGITRGSFSMEKLTDGINGVEGSYMMTVSSLKIRFLNPQTAQLLSEVQPLDTLKVFAMPANNGKTIFLQGATEPFTGVCQF